MSLDIRQLRYAIAAADHRSFHRASIALEIEQSTLSRTIIKLERIVGVQLFSRSRAGVKPTIPASSSCAVLARSSPDQSNSSP